MNIQTLPALIDVLALENIEYKQKGNTLTLSICPFCGKHHCNVNTKLNVFNCFNCGTNGGVLKFYGLLHNCTTKEALKQLNDNNFTPSYYCAKPIVQVEEHIDDIDYLNSLYNDFLEKLPLMDKHKRNLLKRGLQENELSEYRSCNTIFVDSATAYISKRLDEQNVAGFYKFGGKWVSSYRCYNGFIMPVKSMDGKITTLLLRNDNSRDDRKYIILSSADRPQGIRGKSYPHYTTLIEKDMYQTAIITEGVLKANCIYSLCKKATGKLEKLKNIPVVGLGGVNNLTLFIDNLQELKRRGIKNFYIAYDMDKLTNDNVIKAQNRLIERLELEGFNVAILNWDSNYKGFDDYLASIIK